MDNIRNMIDTHRVLASVLVIGFAVFINCFGFPIYNISRDWPSFIQFEYVFLALLPAFYIGGGMAILIPEKRYLFTVSFLAVLACAGMGCRFLLEFGEVSNTYNFVAPNIVLHLGVFLVLTSLSWLYVVKKTQSEY